MKIHELTIFKNILDLYSCLKIYNDNICSKQFLGIPLIMNDINEWYFLEITLFFNGITLLRNYVILYVRIT